jgi:hypothetical protein
MPVVIYESKKIYNYNELINTDDISHIRSSMMYLDRIDFEKIKRGLLDILKSRILYPLGYNKIGVYVYRTNKEGTIQYRPTYIGNFYCTPHECDNIDEFIESLKNSRYRSKFKNSYDIYHMFRPINESINECPVCLEMKSLIELPCGHEICKECYERMKSTHPRCPLCRSNFFGFRRRSRKRRYSKY